MTADVDHAPLIHHGDAIAGEHRAQAVGDHQHGAPGAELGDRLVDLLLALGVDLAGRLVHEQDRGITQHGAGDGNALTLANLRAAEQLERKVEQRTAELNERVGELEIINAIQRGVAAELNFQAIVVKIPDFEDTRLFPVFINKKLPVP